MNNIKIDRLIEYLSLALILSYFIIHSIYLVLIGIIFSLYLININLINSFHRSINKFITSKKGPEEIEKNIKNLKPDYIQMNSTQEDSKLTLVETIEELGFIPTLDKNNDNNAA